MATSSAVPSTLVAYATNAQQLNDDLRLAARTAREALAAFRSASPHDSAGSTDPADAAADYATRNDETDAWVGRVGMRFLLADGLGLLFGLHRFGSVVTIDDTRLAGAGFPSRTDAANAGRTFAASIAPSLTGDDEIDRDALEAWRDEMALHAGDAAFAVAFYERLGADGAHRIALAIERNWPNDEYGRPTWGLDMLAPFSRALATAMDTRHALVGADDVRDDDNVDMPANFRLDESFVDALLEVPYTYSQDEPDEHHLTLLFREGVFPADVLLRLAEQVATPRLTRGMRAGPVGFSPWAWEADPVATTFGAVSRNQDASLAYLETHDDEWYDESNLRMLLDRWAEIDGDGGAAAAEVFRQALTHPDRARSAALFDATVGELVDIGEVRNYFAFTAFADGAAFHIDRLATTAATEGDLDALVETHRFLELLLVDSEAAAAIFDAALQETSDTFARAENGDALGSEVWRVGGLLGLVLSADTAADIDDAEARVARREALLNGIGQISDLALTLTRGRWIPFVREGRDALLDQFRNTDEVNDALEDLAGVRDAYQREMSELIAVRLVHNGVLDPKPAHVDMDDWVNSDEVRDAIGELRAQAGQRFDEVLALLEHER